MKKTLILLAAVLTGLTLHVRAAVPPVEKLLPDDTLALLSIPDFAKARGIYSNSPQGQLWQDVSVKAFKDKFMGKLAETLIVPLERELGVHFDDYAGLPQGQFTLAVTQNGWDGDTEGKEPGLLLLVDTKNQSGQLKTNLTALKKKWVEAGKTVRTEKIRDVDFSVINLTSNDVPKSLKGAAGTPPDATGEADAAPPKPAVKREVYIGQSDSLLLLGNSAKTIEKVLARVAGADMKTVGDLPAFEANRAALFRDAAGFGWVNAKVLVDLLTRKLESLPPNPMDIKPAKVVAALGLGGLQSLAFSYRYSDEGMQGEFFIGVPEAGRAGLFKLLAGEAKETAPPAFVPADVVTFQRWRIDGQKAWATLQGMVGDISPQFRNNLDLLLNVVESGAKEKNPGFDIKRNLFGNLGDDFMSYAKAPKGDSLADLSSQPTLFLIGSPNAEQLAGALQNFATIFGSQGSAPKDREFLGKKIYTVPLPSLPGAPSGGAGLSYAFSGGYLALSTVPAMLEEYLRSSQSDGKSLKDMAGLGDALQKVAGGGGTMAGFSNDRESMRVTWEALKKDFSSATGSLGPVVAMLGLGDESKLKEWVDVSLMPGFDKISKYFSFTVYAETPTADGISFKTFTPLPPQLRK